jgi:hypothetical protein
MLDDKAAMLHAVEEAMSQALIRRCKYVSATPLLLTSHWFPRETMLNRMWEQPMRHAVRQRVWLQ